MDDARRELVEIELAAVSTPEELQSVLARSLGFPEFYGHNWNAFWDAITGLVEMPRRLRLIGWAGLMSRLPDDARQLGQCLDDAAAHYPGSSASVEFA